MEIWAEPPADPLTGVGWYNTWVSTQTHINLEADFGSYYKSNIIQNPATSQLIRDPGFLLLEKPYENFT